MGVILIGEGLKFSAPSTPFTLLNWLPLHYCCHLPTIAAIPAVGASLLLLLVPLATLFTLCNRSLWLITTKVRHMWGLMGRLGRGALALLSGPGSGLILRRWLSSYGGMRLVIALGGGPTSGRTTWLGRLSLVPLLTTPSCSRLREPSVGCEHGRG